MPDVDEHGIPMMPEEGTGATTDDGRATPAVDDNGWAAWHEDPKQEFEIEKVVSASKAGRGWRVMVKWVGYPEPTEEALWKILKQTNHPTVIDEIEKCKHDYLAQFPGESSRRQGCR